MSCVQDLDTVVARKKRRSVNKSNVRPIGNASIEVLQKRRAEKPEQRKASREAALRYAALLYGYPSNTVSSVNNVMHQPLDGRAIPCIHILQLRA